MTHMRGGDRMPNRAENETRNKGLGHSYSAEDVSRAFNNAIREGAARAAGNGLPAENIT